MLGAAGAHRCRTATNLRILSLMLLSVAIVSVSGPSVIMILDRWWMGRGAGDQLKVLVLSASHRLIFSCIGTLYDCNGHVGVEWNGMTVRSTAQHSFDSACLIWVLVTEWCVGGRYVVRRPFSSPPPPIPHISQVHTSIRTVSPPLDSSRHLTCRRSSVGLSS